MYDIRTKTRMRQVVNYYCKANDGNNVLIVEKATIVSSIDSIVPEFIKNFQGEFNESGTCYLRT